ncbi:ATP-binding cassette domain-containing protein [Streptomyces coeruleorubidus]|uniref:ATP-binding cassette domain-containing protein n=1 Tax=Streptomyces coeruleorubidus TaxID=116188 RepID=UPI0033AC9279
MAELSIIGVHKAYGPVQALSGVYLSVRSRALVAVLGPSGSGKTTLLRCIAGFERPDAGEIRIDCRAVATPNASVPPERRRIAVVPQEGALFPHVSVLGNVAVATRRIGGRPNSHPARHDRTHAARRRCADRSGARAATARADHARLASDQGRGHAAVVRRDFYGHDATLALRLTDGTPVAARVFDPAALPPAVGDQVALRVRGTGHTRPSGVDG